jgi:hypothetical protein
MPRSPTGMIASQRAPDPTARILSGISSSAATYTFLDRSSIDAAFDRGRPGRTAFA